MSNREAGNRAGRASRPLPSHTRPGFGRQLLRFTLVSLVALAFVAWGGLAASKRAGTSLAIDEVRQLTETVARTVVEPNLSGALLAGEADALAQFDKLVKERILSTSVVRVKLWTREGRVVYSDEGRLIGETFVLREDELQAMADGLVLAEVTDLEEATNQYETHFDHSLEVYTPVWTSDSEQLLYEMYFLYDLVATTSSHIWAAFFPIVFGSLAILGAVFIPLAWRMTRHLQRNQQERERLLLRALEGQDLEDRRIAAGLHDGVVQELAAASFNLAAIDDLLKPDTDPETQEMLNGSAASVRASMLALRTLVVDIFPPNLREEGLEAALLDLLGSLETKGVATSLEMPSAPDLPLGIELLAYRTVRESLRNVAAHADARNVTVKVSPGVAPFSVEIIDDGRGFDPTDSPDDGHIGLRLLSDLAADADAKLEVTSTPGSGTAIRLEATP